MSDEPTGSANTTWLPANAPIPATVSPELAVARVIAAENPKQLFEPQSALRTVQAFASNTRRGYANDWSSFVECCRQHGFQPLPATSSAVQTFIEWRSPEQPDLVSQGLYRHVKPGMSRQPIAAASLRRAIAAIGAVHRALKYPDPTVDEDVRATIKINVAGRQVQSHKDPLRWADLERAFANTGDDLHALRDKALAAVGHSTGFRRSELVALTVEDYVRQPGRDFALMAVRRTKTDDPRELKFRAVVPEAVEHLERWLAAAGITHGGLFRGITADGRVNPNALDAGQVARIYKVIAQLAGVDVKRVAGHSTRIGVAHDLRAFGASDSEIMEAAGWTSLASLLRYLRGRDAEEGAMIRMARARANPHSQT
jgi:site-specific recombinase XerD